MAEMHLILASTCGHPLRYSPHLPNSDTALDFDNPLCTSCLATESIKREHDEAEAEHKLLCQQDGADFQLRRASNKRFRLAKVALLRDLASRAERRHFTEIALAADVVRGDGGLPTPPITGANSPTTPSPRKGRGDSDCSPSSHRCLRKKKSVRFDDSPMQVHRPESQYRCDLMFLRTAPGYQPGRWADLSGEGFENTSGPSGEDEGVFEARAANRRIGSKRSSEEMEEEEGEEEEEEEDDDVGRNSEVEEDEEKFDSDDYSAELEELTDAQLAEREREVRLTLAMVNQSIGMRE